MGNLRRGFSLLELAPELRNLIYQYLFSEIVELNWEERGIEAVATDFKGRTSILATCRQIRHESLPVFNSSLMIVHHGTNISFASLLLMKNVAKFTTTTHHWRNNSDEGWLNWYSSLRLLEFWPQRDSWTFVPTLEIDNGRVSLIDALRGSLDKAWVQLMVSERFAGEKVEKPHGRCELRLYSVLGIKSRRQDLYVEDLQVSLAAKQPRYC